MRGTKRLSVVIPGYNNPSMWWRRCVCSVLSAIGDDDEVICVDDGSSKKTDLQTLEGLDGRVKMLYLDQNVGPAAARNVALDMIQGRYVTFVDSDDEVLPGAYNRILNYMAETGSGVGVFGVKVIWTKEGLVKHDIPQKKEYGVLLPQDLKCLYEACLFNYACNKVYDVHAIEKMSRVWNFRFEKGGMPCEDVIFNLQVAMTGVKWCGVDEIGYVYYRTGGSSLSRYKSTNGIGNRAAAKVWDDYCKVHAVGNDDFEKERHWSEKQQAHSDWANIWMPGTPYGFVDRYKWLQEHGEIGGLKFFIETAVKRMLRKYLYLRAIRRWHIRKLYPQVEEWK